jgi:PAS domain S-box-containing protein
MPSAIQIRRSKAGTRSTAWLLATVFILVSGWAINLCVVDAGLAHNHGESKHILYINSYHPGYSWSDDIQKGLTQRLQASDLEIEMSVEYLDSRRFNKPALRNKQADILLTKYSGYRFDLVVVSDNAAFQFAVGNRGLLFPGVPIVFCGYNNFRSEILYGFSDITGVNEEMDFDSLIRTALFIQPEIRTLAFILSTGDASNKAIAEKIERVIIPNYRRQFNIVRLKDAPMSRIREALGRLPGNSALFLMGQTSDVGRGRALTPGENGRLISAACPVPTYTLWDFHLNTGVVGGRILSGIDQGQAAAALTLQILNGKSADSIPVIMASPTRNIFDYNAMKRFKITMDALPEKSIVINKPYAFYDAHKRSVGIILSVFAALVAFIIVLSINILMRIRAEKELQKHRDQLEILVQERTAELTDTNRALIDSEERFRCLSDAGLEGIAFSEKGTIIEINNACCEMFGYLRSEVINKTATDFIAPEEREKVKLNMSSGLEKSYTSIGLKKNGTTFPVEIQGRMFSYKGRVVRVSAIRDLTRQKQAEDEINTLRDILPICLFCKKVRDDKGYWEQVDIYIHKYYDTDISHGICPECAKTHYPEQFKAIMKKKK